MRFLAAAACVFLASGCAPQNSFRFSFDGPEEDYQRVAEAAAEWESCGGVNVEIVRGRVAGVDATIRRVTEIPRHPERGENASRDDAEILYTLGHAGGEWGPDWTRAIIAHEMGHIMGAEHVSDPSALMFWSPENPAAVGPADCDSLRER